MPRAGHPDMPAGAAHGYMETSATDPTLRDVTAVDPSYPWAAGALVSTTDDLARFARALHERRLLSAAYRDELYVEIPEAPGYSYGAGITKDAHADTVGHDGNIFGYECSSQYLVGVEIAVAACVNRSLFDATLPPSSSLQSVVMEKVVATLRLPDIADERIEAFRRTGKIEGIQLAIAVHGRSVVKRYGQSAPGRPWAERDLFRFASVSKSFLAALVHKVAASGELALTSTVDAYVPAALLPHIDLTQVTIGHLLRHASGVPDFFTDDFLQAIIDHPDVAKTEADALAAVKDRPGAFAPGTCVRYSNTNYVLLGIILDQVAKRRGLGGHESLLRELVLGPLALEATFYERKEAALFDPGTIVSGFLDGKDHRDVQQGYGLPSGGLVSTVGDVATFFGALFDPRSALPVGPAMAPHASDDFGHGLYRLRSGQRLIGHTGELAGYLSFAAYDPETGTTVVGLANDASPAAKVEFGKLQEYVFGLLGQERSGLVAQVGP